jgi:hypothetical protein
MCHSLGAHVRRKTLQSALQVLQVLQVPVYEYRAGIVTTTGTDRYCHIAVKIDVTELLFRATLDFRLES